MKCSERARMLLCAAVFSSACGPKAPEAELRSPSNDYPPPGPTTADGQVIGADRKPVTDATGPATPPPKEPKTEK